MMTSAKRASEVQPLAWRFTDQLPEQLRYVPVLRMPAPIKNGLRHLTNFANGKIPPITSLYSALAAFAPEILAFASIKQLLFTPEADPQWLYMYPGQDIRVERLKTFISVWLSAWLGGDEAQRLADQWFKAPSWSWDHIDLNTADYDLRRRLLPALVTRHLITSQFQLPLSNGQGMTLKHDLLFAPLMESQLTAQLITQRETYHGDSYAFVLKLWLGTMPPDNTEVLMQRVTVRRWVSQSLVKGTFVNLPYGKSSSVYWQRSTGYLSDSPPLDVYTKLTLKQVGRGVENVLWVGQQAKVLRALNWGTALPEASAFVHDPAAAQPNLLLVQTQQMSIHHNVGAGVWSNDHREVFQAVTPLIEAFAAPLDPAPRKEPKWKKGKKAEDRLKNIPNEVRYHALCALPNPIRIELYLDDVEFAKRIILEEVGIVPETQPLSANPLRVMDGARLLLEIAHGDHRITSPLPTTTQSEYKKSKEERAQALTKLLSATRLETGALVTLLDYRWIKGQKWSDPKEAIREGLRDSGRTSEFCTPEEKGYETRLRNTVRSLLRTLGFRFNPLYQKEAKSSLPDNVDIFALWIVQRNAVSGDQQTVMLPMVVHVQHGKGINLLLPSTTNSPIRYLSLQQGILAAEKSSREFGDDQRKAVVQFFRRALEDCNRGQDALLLVWEANTRRVFETDDVAHLLFPDGALRTRTARLRFSQYNTAPLCVPRSPYSKYPGLFQSDDTLFYSLHNVGDRQVFKEALKNEALGNPAVNPAACLIWLTELQPEDQPHEWAWLVHQLRDESSHTDIPTQLPQPLHDLRLIGKYLSRYVDEEIDEEVDEAENT